jgi:hypothetical protein
MTIDTTKIEGYAEMTPEQKLAALEAYDIEVPKPDYTGYIKKEQFDKTASELARLKKEQLDRLDEAERAKALAAQELEDLKARNAELEKSAKIAEYKSKYLARGYDDALAEETARAYVEGDTDKVFANHDKFMDTHDKQVKASMLGGTGTPPAGSGDGSYKSKDDIMKIRDTEERQAAIAANPSLFGL